MEILSKIEFLSPNDKNFEFVLSELDLYIKQNEGFRSQTPNNLFTILYLKFSTLSQSDQKQWSILRLILKCIKNSAASFKSEFSSQECDTCDKLVQFLDPEILSNSATIDENEFHCHLNVLQYIFNLVQGNKTALDKRHIQWTNLVLSLLTRPNLDLQVYDISSMILLSSFKEIENSEQFYNDIFSRLNFSNFIYLVEYVEQKFKNESLENKFSNWTFKLLDKMFDFIYSKYLVESDVESFSKKFRFFVIYHISDRLLDCKETNIQKCYLNFKSLEFICQMYVAAFKNLLREFDQILDQDFDNVLDLFKQSKLIAGVLGDFLTMEETRHQNNQMVGYVQNKSQLFELTCQLFKEINCNTNYLILLERQKDKKLSEWFLLKCELVRMIGILVFENEQNQNYLVNDQMLEIIANNLNLDIDNPFLREWSIVALKHILCQLDKK